MEEYIVQRVEKVRTVKGRKEYYLKWKGYPRSLNSWEPADKLNCLELIEKFEESLEKKSRLRKKTPKTVSKDKTTQSKNQKTNSKGNGNGHKEEAIKPVQVMEPLKILGATNVSGQLKFLIQWKNSNRSDLVVAKVANIMCPQVVIQFYEERLLWH